MPQNPNSVLMDSAKYMVAKMWLQSGISEMQINENI